MYVAEFTLHAKPGHFDEVSEIYSSFAADFLSQQKDLEAVLILGDEASGLVRGIGLWGSKDAADAVNSEEDFARFNDRVAPLLARPSERVELALLHNFVKGR